jgi:hypothetical protein
MTSCHVCLFVCLFFCKGSSLGAWDGNVYERLMQFARDSQFNKTDVHDVFHKYMRPYVLRSQRMSKL